MKLKIDYKTITTAFLLVLYAFIATPVSYWHHHNNNCDKNESEQHLKIVKKSTSSEEGNCKICAHNYSVDSNDAISIYFSAFSFYSSYNSFFFINNITNPGYSQSNKGPPAIA